MAETGIKLDAFSADELEEMKQTVLKWIERRANLPAGSSLNADAATPETKAHFDFLREIERHLPFVNDANP